MSKSKKIEMIECPFCGGQPWAKLAWKETKKRCAIYSCECRQCDATLYDDSVESVSARWNKRVTHAKLSNELHLARLRIKQFGSAIVDLEREFDEKEAELSGEEKRFKEAAKDIVEENVRLKKKMACFAEKFETMASDLERMK